MPDSSHRPQNRLEGRITFKIEPVKEIQDFAASWQDLQSRADVNFFLTWDWIGHWLEEIQVRCYAVTGRLAGRIVALAFFTHASYRRHGLLKLNALVLNETGDPDTDVVTIEYNGILTDQRVTAEATLACLEFLQGSEVAAAIGGRWDEICFGGVPQSFERYLDAKGLRVWHHSHQPSWAVDLDGVRRSGRSYLDHLSANTRYQVRRALRLYEERGPVTAMPARSVEEAMQFYSAMQDLHQRYWIAKGESGSYAFPFYRRMHERILADCIPRRTVEIVRVSAGNSVIGYVYNFTAQGWICAYHTGFSYDHDPKLKPGLVSHYLCIERHLQEGARRYDFLAGDHRYKANLGVRGPDIMHLYLQRRVLKIDVEHALRKVKSQARLRFVQHRAPERAEEKLKVEGYGGRPKVLVLGDDTRSFLTIVRSLGRQAIEVHAAPFNMSSPALRSRYIAKVHRLPNYVDAGGEWVGEISALLVREQYDLVIPCDDRTLLPLSANRKQFANAAKLAIPDPQSVMILFDKERTKSLAASVGVNLARTLLPEDCDEPNEVFRRLGTRVVVKPKHSYELNTLFQRGVVRIVNSPAELARMTEGLSKRQYYFESYFPGSGVGLSVLADKGEILLAFQHHRVHENERGTSAYRISAPIAPELMEACRRMLGALSYTGLAMFEFRRNFANGDWILLEVNARPWGSMPLPVGLGVDFPYTWYRLIVRRERPSPTSYRKGVYGRNLLLDIYYVIDQVSETRGLLGRIRVVAAWAAGFWPFFLLRERSDTFVRDDMRPATAEVAEFLRTVSSRVERRTPGLRWVRRIGARRRLVQAARSARRKGRSFSVLFLCHGNICRSAFAEGAMAKLLPNGDPCVRIASAGTMPVKGRPSPDEAIVAAKRLGVDLGGHRSHYADDQALSGVDVIFYFDDRNKEALRARFPELTVAAIGLGLFTGGANASWDIEDPYGRDSAFYDRTFSRIMDAVRTVHATIAEIL